ncbi:MAG: hypothetical protein ACYS9X_28985, partial [Planctomycetota bacterium]
TIRNAVKLGSFVPGTTRLGIALYHSFAPGSGGGWDEDRVPWPAELEGLDELGRDRFLRQAAFRELGARPARGVGLAFLKLGRLWSPVPWADGYRGARYWTVGIAAFVILVGGAIAGAVMTRARWRDWWPLVAPAAYLTAMHAVFYGSLRFRVPAHATLAVLAGVAFAALAAGRRPCDGA